MKWGYGSRNGSIGVSRTQGGVTRVVMGKLLILAKYRS